MKVSGHLYLYTDFAFFLLLFFYWILKLCGSFSFFILLDLSLKSQC